MKDILNVWSEIRPRTAKEWKNFLKVAGEATALAAGGYCAIYLGCLLG